MCKKQQDLQLYEPSPPPPLAPLPNVESELNSLKINGINQTAPDGSIRIETASRHLSCSMTEAQNRGERIWTVNAIKVTGQHWSE